MKKFKQLIPNQQVFNDQTSNTFDVIFKDAPWLKTNSYLSKDKIYYTIALQYNERFLRYPDDEFINYFNLYLIKGIENIYIKQQIWLDQTISDQIKDPTKRGNIATSVLNSTNDSFDAPSAFDQKALPLQDSDEITDRRQNKANVQNDSSSSHYIMTLANLFNSRIESSWETFLASFNDLFYQIDNAGLSMAPNSVYISLANLLKELSLEVKANETAIDVINKNLDDIDYWFDKFVDGDNITITVENGKIKISAANGGGNTNLKSYFNLEGGKAYRLGDFDLSSLRSMLVYTSVRRDVFSFQGLLSFAYTQDGLGNTITFTAFDPLDALTGETIDTPDEIGVFYFVPLNNDNFQLWYIPAENTTTVEVDFTIVNGSIYPMFVNNPQPQDIPPANAQAVIKAVSDMFYQGSLPQDEQTIYINSVLGGAKLELSTDDYKIVNNAVLSGDGIAIDRDPNTKKITFRSTGNIANVKKQYNAADFNTPAELINAVQIGDSVLGDFTTTINWFKTTIPVLTVFDKDTGGANMTLFGQAGKTGDKVFITISSTDTWPVSAQFSNPKIGPSNFASEVSVQTNDLAAFKVVSDNTKTDESGVNEINNVYLLGQGKANYKQEQKVLVTQQNLLENNIYELQIPPASYGVLYDIKEPSLGVPMRQGIELSIYPSPETFTANRTLTVYPGIDGNNFPNTPANSTIAFVFDKYNNDTNNGNDFGDGYAWLQSLNLTWHVATYEDSEGNNHWTFGVRNTNTTENRTIYIRWNGYLQYNASRTMAYLPYKVLDENDIAWYDFGKIFYKNTWVDRTSDLDDTNDWITNEGYTLARVRLTTNNRKVSAYCTSEQSNVYFYIQNGSSGQYTVWNRFVDGTNLVHFDGSNTSTEGITKLEIYYE